MHHLGHTRSRHTANHLLHTPDAFVRAPWPGMTKATAVVHTAPVTGAKFTQYTAEFSQGGELAAGPHQRFVYVLEGQVQAAGQTLAAGDYAYLPSDGALLALTAARVAVIEKPYQGVAMPGGLTGRESDIAPQPLMGDPDLEVRSLIPADPAFDFAVNTMTFAPGATLPMVEIHVMEHGLLFLAGGGIYRLGDDWYPVTAGDFIYMAPYCPQWFGALGKSPAKYLIYKDWNRPPL
ncbi:MAG: (S)-ureidoglycine aminohydrolase [Bryobacteraceae bacterium]|nr:(S)-ureidoglycine aminohydrolase [Bryobacteraceae bacterium]